MMDPLIKLEQDFNFNDGNSISECLNLEHNVEICNQIMESLNIPETYDQDSFKALAKEYLKEYSS
jgi:hypothetical protein